MNEIIKESKKIVEAFKNKVTNENVMKLYYNIESNGHKPQPLNEVTVDRILQKHGNKGMIIISANRSDENGETNNQNTKSLIADIRATNRSYFPVYGGYHDSNDIIDSYEPSFVVTNYDRSGKEMDFNELYKFAVAMCGKYNQHSVLVKAPNDVPHYYDSNGKQLDSNSTGEVIKNDPKQEFFTSLIKTNNLDKEHPERSKRFTYDLKVEWFANPKPCTLNERMFRRKSGEILIY